MVAWEQARLDAIVADIFGFNAVQLGVFEVDALRNNRMPFQFYADEGHSQLQAIPDTTSPRCRVVTYIEELPFESQSLDLVVLPHALEFADDPHQVLREVERVLIPEGHLVVTGFNPASLWGLRQMVGRATATPFLPQAGQFLAVPRLKDWLKLLSFDVARGHFGCYRPPCRSTKWMDRFGFLEKAGDRWWPICGAVYMMSAVKRVRGMRLIGPKWKELKPAAGALSPRAQRTRTVVGFGDARAQTEGSDN